MITNTKILLILFFVLVLAGCRLFKEKRSPRSTNEVSTTLPASSDFTIPDSSEVVFLKSLSYATGALDQYSIKILKNKYSQLLHYSLEPVENPHDSALTDTIYTFSNRTNEIKVYRARHQDFIYSFRATSRILKIKEDVRTGMKKELFFKKFQIPVSARNIVQISNPDGNMMTWFYFKNNRLRLIDSQAYLD